MLNDLFVLGYRPKRIASPSVLLSRGNTAVCIGSTDKTVKAGDVTLFSEHGMPLRLKDCFL